MTFPRRLALFPIALAIASALPAQVRPGWGIYARINIKNYDTTGGGLTIFQPYNGTGLSICPQTATVPVTNLPAPLAFKVKGQVGGTNCVLVRDTDGTVVASTVRFPQQSIAIYHLVLNGARVDSARSRTHTFGTVVKNPVSGTGTGTIDQMAWLDDDRVVFCYRDITHSNWPTANGIGILQLSTGRFTRIPITFPSGIGSINAMALDRQKRTIWMGFFGPNSIHSVPISGGTATAMPLMPSGPFQLDVDENGMVYIGTFSLGLYSLDPTATPPSYTRLNMIRATNGMTIDRITGDVLFTQSHTGLWPSHMFRYLPGSKGLLPVTGMAKLDFCVGIAIRSSMIPRGTGSSAYEWKLAPNPGGAPLLGNSKFSLTQTTTATPIQSVMMLSGSLLTRPVRILGADLWLGTPILSVPMTINTTRTEISVKVPLPTLKSLCGLSVYAQSYSIAGTGLSASRPLQIAFQ